MRIRDIDSVVVVHLTFVIILGWTRTAHAFDLTSLVDSFPRETCVGEILSFGAWKCLVSLTAVFGIVTQRNGEERCVTTLKTAV